MGRCSRRSLVLDGALLPPVALAACAGPAGPGGDPARPAAGKSAATIRFTTSGAARLADAWQPVLDLYNKPGAPVQLQFTPLEADGAAGGQQGRGGGYRERLAGQIAAGNPPDVVALGIFDLLAFVEQGAIGDLSAHAKARKPGDIQLDDFWPEQLEACKVKGALYGLPWQGDALLLFYNDALFQAKNLRTPRDLLQAGNWTWQTFVEAAQRVAGPAPPGLQSVVESQRRAAAQRAARSAARAPAGAAGPSGAPAAAGQAPPAPGANAARIYGTDRGPWETWVWSNGGELLDPALARCLLDSPAAIEAFGFVAGLATRYQVVPSQRDLRGVGEVALFDNGQLGMFFDTRNAVPRLARLRDGTWDAVPVPRGRRGSVSRLSLSVFAVAAAAPAEAEAFEAVRFLTSPAAQRQWAKRGEAVPSRKSAATSPEFLQFAGPTQATEKANASFLEAVQKGNARLLPLLARWPDLHQAANRELRPVFTGDREPADGARAAKAAVEQLLTG